MIVHPSLHLLSGYFSRADLFLVVYCLVDDWMHAQFHQSNAPRGRRGPRPGEFSDAEVLTVLLVGELCHCHREQAWLRQVRHSYGPLFPALPEASRFSRRATQAQALLRPLRQAILSWADADLEPIRLLDSFPMPLCACYRIRQSSQPISGATFGYNASKRLFFYGLHPGLLTTASGFIVDLILAPGNLHDVPLLTAYLDECAAENRDLRGQTWVMDKGFRSQPLVQTAQERLGLRLLPRQPDLKTEPAPFAQQLLDQVRKPIEGVISVLTECFGIEHLLVKTDLGLYRRTQAKATAFTLARFFNRVLGLEPLHIARYAV
jgi:hypothetical protein